jgi:predicted neuraminidase
MKLVALAREFLLPGEHALFADCHASTIACLPGGQLAAAFFAGSREGAGDTAIWLARTRGGVWQAPVRLIAEDGLAHWNPVLHAEDSTLWLFYKVGRSVHEWTTRLTISHDAGRTWTSPRALVPGDRLPRGPVRNKLLLMSNGEWIAPASLETDETWNAFVDISPDRGETWHKHEVPIDHGQRGGALASSSQGEIWAGLAANALWESDVERVFRWDGVIQPTLWESPPGRMHMLLRSTRGRIYRSDSDDYGRTWLPAYATILPNNNSGIDLARLEDGRLVLACNPVGGNWGRRHPISLVGSEDDGVTWEHLVDLENEEGEFSYPALVAGASCLYLTYTWNRRNIVYGKIAIE